MNAPRKEEPPRIFTPEYYLRMHGLETASWWNAAMRDVAAALLEHMDLPRSGAMLDVGCGSGQTMAWFQIERSHWSVMGLDLAAEGVLAAKASGQRVMQASATDLPLTTGSTDLIITLDVLQHLPLDGGDLRALAEMRRVLKPGGVLLIRTNAQAFPRAAADRQFNFRKYTPKLLRATVVASGLEVVVLGRVNALLGLAEIPRELRARLTQESHYHGILSTPRPASGLADSLKRRWVRLEGRALRLGWNLPFGRTIFAICRKPV